MRGLLAAIFLAAALPFPLAAQPPAGSEAPVTEALVGRFIASMPDQEAVRRREGVPDARLMDELRSEYPGREEQLREVLVEHSRCLEPLAWDAAVRTFAAVARELGSGRVERLIRFWEGPDFPVFVRLRAKERRGEGWTGSEAAEASRIAAEYPLFQFSASFRRHSAETSRSPALGAGRMRCIMALRAALGGDDMRYVPVPRPPGEGPSLPK